MNTSLEAAIEIQTKAPTIRQQVLAFILSNPEGVTDEEIQVGLGINPSTQRPRRIELEDMGFIRTSGSMRKTVSGRNALVWKAVA